MSDELKPAITAEAWAAIRPDPPVEADFHARKVARHNAKLPDGDPRKITRDEVDFLALYIESANVEMDNVGLLVRLHDKLRALLPPE
jgi:hypothetical protein